MNRRLLLQGAVLALTLRPFKDLRTPEVVGEMIYFWHMDCDGRLHDGWLSSADIKRRAQHDKYYLQVVEDLGL